MTKRQIYFAIFIGQLLSLIYFNGLTINYIYYSYGFIVGILGFDLFLYLKKLFLDNWKHPLNGFTDYIYKGNQPFTLDPNCTELWHGSTKKLISVEDLYKDYLYYGKSITGFEKHFK